MSKSPKNNMNTAQKPKQICEKIYRQFYETLWFSEQIGISIVDENNIFVDMNESHLKMNGYDYDEIVGQPLTILFSPSLPINNTDNVDSKIVSNYKSPRNVSTSECYIVTKNGKRKKIRASISHVKTELGKTYRIIISTDISTEDKLLIQKYEQKQINEAQADVLQMVVSKNNLQDVLKKIVRHVTEISNCIGCSIALLEGDILRTRAYHFADKIDSLNININNQYKNFAEPLSILKIEQLSLEKGFVIVNDTKNDARLSPDIERGNWVESFASIPILAGQQILGWLWLDSEEKNSFRPDEIFALKPFLDAAAVSIRNAQLHQKSQQELEQRKKMQVILAHNEAELRAVLEAIPDTFMHFNKQGILLDIKYSKKKEIAIRKYPELMIGRALIDIFPAKIANALVLNHAKLFETGKMQVQECELVINNEKHHLEVRWVFVGKESLAIFRDITEQKAMAYALKSSQDQLSLIVNTMSDIVIMLDSKNIVTFSNVNEDSQNIPSFQLIRKSMPFVYMGLSFIDNLPSENQAKARMIFDKVRETGKLIQLEIMLDVKNGNIQIPRGWPETSKPQLTLKQDSKESEYWFLTRLQKASHGTGEIVMVLTDISELKRKSSRLEQSIKERTILLKEIHHRVKNNMQVISSLLELRSLSLPENSQSSSTKNAFKESRERIRTMALVHEVMYETEHFDAIEFDRYLKKLLHVSMRAYATKEVNLRLELSPVLLKIDQAISCGLIVNELISNALKYAFTEPREDLEKNITVKLQQNNSKRVTLSICDNGVGMPEEIINQPNNSRTSLGMTIIESLTEQLEGTLNIHNVTEDLDNSGCCVKLIFLANPITNTLGMNL